MTLKTKISTDWKSWIQSNLERGVEKAYLFNTLIENGFSYQSVVKEMNFEPELKQTLSNEWKDWLNENISKNQNKDALGAETEHDKSRINVNNTAIQYFRDKYGIWKD